MIRYKEKTLDMHNVKKQEVVRYFLSLGGQEVADGDIVGNGWEAELLREAPAAQGPARPDSVTVSLRCESGLFDHMVSLCYIRFFRAGGCRA